MENRQVFGKRIGAERKEGTKPPQQGMSTENTGVQTKAMAEAQRVEEEANRDPINNLERAQDTQNPARNPTVDPHRTREEVIKEFV